MFFSLRLPDNGNKVGKKETKEMFEQLLAIPRGETSRRNDMIGCSRRERVKLKRIICPD